MPTPAGHGMIVPARRRPPGRYDEPSLLGQRVLAVALSALLVGLLVAVGFALYQRYGGQAVTGRVVSFAVRSDSRVVLDVEVSKPAGETAYCLVRARGRDGREVGRDVAVLDATGTPSRTARGTFTIATSARAVTGELAGCRVERLTRSDIAP